MINIADSDFYLNTETVAFVICLLPINYSLAP